jgi:lysozyme
LEEAEALLKDDVRKFASGIDNMLEVKISDTKFCALLSFAYNVGLGVSEGSTLLKLLNEGQLGEVPVQLLRWTKSNRVELPGLKRRR